jgi:hypothetical protein
MAKPRTIDGKFNQRYYSAPTSIHNQPGKSSRVPASKRFAANDSTRNARVQTSKRTKPTIDEEFNAAYAKKGIQPISLADRKKKNKKTSLAAIAGGLTPTGLVRGAAMRRLAKRKGATDSAASAVLEMKARVKATRVNMMIWSWGTYLWLFVQLPFAILSIILFIVGGIMGKITEWLNTSQLDGSSWSVLEEAARWGLGTYLKVIDTLTLPSQFILTKGNELLIEHFDIDLSFIRLEDLFFILYVFIIAMAIFQFFVIYLIYKISSLNPLYGKGAWFKIASLLLAFIGYCVPGFNLFPWYMVWTGAVWIKPK